MQVLGSALKTVAAPCDEAGAMKSVRNVLWLSPHSLDNEPLLLLSGMLPCSPSRSFESDVFPGEGPWLGTTRYKDNARLQWRRFTDQVPGSENFLASPINRSKPIPYFLFCRLD